MNDLLKTVNGEDIPVTTRAILFLCDLDYKNKTLTIVNELLYNSRFDALNAYSNVRNPESQMVEGDTFQELIKKKKELLEDIQKKEWVEDLMQYI